MKYFYNFKKDDIIIKKDLVCGVCQDTEFDIFCDRADLDIPLPDSSNFKETLTKSKHMFGYECQNCHTIHFIGKLLTNKT